jgi:hypothetical protein
LDKDSIGVNPDPDSESGSGFRRAKKLKFLFCCVGWLLLRAEGFFCNLDVLYGGLPRDRYCKLQFLKEKEKSINFFCQL